MKSLDPPLEIIQRTQSTTSLRFLILFYCLNHLMSNMNIQNWCQRKGVQFGDHTQSQTFKGKSIVWTVIDHQALMAEGIQILSAVNETNASEEKSLALVGDLKSKEVMSC